MATIDLSPLYRNSVGYDRLASLLEGAFSSNQTSSGYPPYDIEVVDDNHYTVTLAVAGFSAADLDIQTENGVLTIRGRRGDDSAQHKYLFQGIATRAFERRFNLADYVEVTGARLENGLLTVDLAREIPEAMKPKRIPINNSSESLEHQEQSEQAA